MAESLCVSDIQLDSSHVSVRLIECRGKTIGDIELEIIAHAFLQRIENKDQRAIDIRKKVEELLLHTKQVRVWLLLCEMGYGYLRG